MAFKNPLPSTVPSPPAPAPKVDAVATATAKGGDFRTQHDINAILAKDRFDRFRHVRVFRRK